MATAYDRARPRSQNTLRAEQLLIRYPDLSEKELGELIALFPHLNMIARGLMAADDRIGARVEAFYRDHGDRIDSGVGPGAILIAGAALAAIFVGMVLT
jgi:hypothetical protein